MHGQVVEGWLRTLHISCVVVASDSVVADSTQKALYSLAVPLGVELQCRSVASVADSWTKGDWARQRVLVLVASAEDALRLVRQGAPVKSINVGGLHFRQGRVQVLKAVSLDADDISALKQLAAAEIALEARPLPLDEPVEISPHLDRWLNELLHGEQPR